MSRKLDAFNEWFDSLTLEEQEQYVAELQAESYIEECKNNPELYYN